jgi:hypothetical protein
MRQSECPFVEPASPCRYTFIDFGIVAHHAAAEVGRDDGDLIGHDLSSFAWKVPLVLGYE